MCGVILLIVLVALSCCGQEKHSDFADKEAQLRFEENGTWAGKTIRVGYATYERMLPESCGRAAVFADGYWGFVDLDGELVVPMQFYAIKSFKEGLAAVRNENYWGYIDISGEYFIRAQYDQVEDFASGTAIVTRNEKVGLIDKKGRYLLALEYDAIARAPGQNRFKICQGWSYGIISLESGQILPIEFSNITFQPDGSIIAWRDGKVGLFDKNGKSVLPPVYLQIEDIGESYLSFSNKDSQTLYNYRLKEIIPTSYKSINKFHNELAPFETQDGKWGFLDPQLKEVIPASYSWVSGFSWYQAVVEDKNGIKIIDNSGQTAKKPNVTVCIYFAKNRLRVVKFNGRHGIQNNLGKWLVRPEYDNFRELADNFVFLKRGYSWLIYPSNNFPDGSPVFDYIRHFTDDRCMVKSLGKSGYLDETATIVIPLQYDEATDIHNGMAAVCKDGLWGFIDKYGNQLQPCIYVHVILQENGSYVVYDRTRSGIVNTKGEFLPVEAETLPPENPDQD